MEGREGGMRIEDTPRTKARTGPLAKKGEEKLIYKKREQRSVICKYNSRKLNVVLIKLVSGKAA